MKKSHLFLLAAAVMAIQPLRIIMAEDAAAVPLPEPFIGVYQVDRTIRAEPAPNTEFQVRVPKGSRIHLTPVNADYAATSYEGIYGYVFYPDAEEVHWPDTPVEPYWATNASAEYAYAMPCFSGAFAAVYPAGSAILIHSHNGEFAVTGADGENRYVPLRALKAVKEDTLLAETQLFLDEASVVLAVPAEGSPVVAILPMGALVTRHALNGIYAAITYEDIGGYVEAAKLTGALRETRQTMLASARVNAVLYTSPNKFAYLDEYLPRGSIVSVETVSGAYAFLPDLDAYVQTELLSKLSVSPLNAFYGYWEEDQPVYLSTGLKSVPSDTALPAKAPVEIRWSASGGYYLVKVDGEWGYVKRNGVKTLKETRLAAPVAAYALKGTPLKAAPFATSQTLTALAGDTPLWLSATLGGYAALTADGFSGYIDADTLQTVGVSQSVRTYEAYADSAVYLLDFPSERSGRRVAMIPGNSLVKTSVHVGGYAYVAYGSSKGYAPLSALCSLDALFADKASDRYIIFIDKSTFLLSVYAASPDGSKTGEAIRKATVALGKRTTPTPTGTFTLGKRERWHYFGPSYAPFAIYYAPGRYLHGPLYYSAGENALNRARLKDFGTMATGGCVRMPYEDILWIYCHCNENNTTVEIVNGI